MASSWIWQQPNLPQFRWNSSALEPLLEQACAARQVLLSRLERLEPPLDLEVISALLGRESLGTAAIEGELLDPGQVRSSIARRLHLPLAEGQPAANAQVEGLLDVLLEATSNHGRATAGPLWRPEARWPSGAPLPGKARWRRRLNQRWLICT